MGTAAAQPPKKILLLAGWSAAGKDTLGRRMAAHGFTRFAFADAVKDRTAEVYRFDRSLADTEEGKRSVLVHVAAGFTVRDALIRFGENEKVAHGKGIWSRRLAEAIAASEATRIVVTDWRFPEELVELQRLLGGGVDLYPLRVTRPGQRVSPVSSMTEYALSGFPMPTCPDATGDLNEVVAYLGFSPETSPPASS
jgi:hypothetical protein